VVGPNGVVPLEIIGLAGGGLSAALAADLLREVAGRIRLLGSRASELAMTAIWQPHLGLASSIGYRHSYADWEMICRNADWGADAPLPAGAQWHEVWPDWVDEYIRVLNNGFAKSPGVFVPRPEEIRRYLQQPGIRARILVEGGRGIGILRMTEPDNYINAVVRADTEKGRGIGRLIMDEARRCLVTRGANDMPMTLTVVDKNTAAIDLYRRCGFEVDRKVAVLIRHL
jgi:ribosomal protein S18 acetylase RimI-like enzyme